MRPPYNSRELRHRPPLQKPHPYRDSKRGKLSSIVDVEDARSAIAALRKEVSDLKVWIAFQ